MIHTTPTKALLATTLRPLVVPLSSALAHGTRLIDHLLHQEPTPQKMATFERELRTLLQAVGRRMMAWVLHHMAPERPEEMPACLWLPGQAYRRRRKHRTTMATLFGTVDVWRRRYEPLVSGSRAIHPLELRVGLEAGVATPALAERLGLWAADHSQRHGLEMWRHDHGVPWSCTTLRQRLSSLSAGLAPYRQAAQVARVVGWRPQTRAAHGRLQPTLAVGRDGVNVPMRPRAWKEGSTATVAVLKRRGQRVGTVYLGQMPEPGQPPLTAQLTALRQDILRPVDAPGLRWVSVSDEGSHPRDYSHSVVKKMLDPQRPWRHLEWRRSVDDYPACLSSTQLAEALLGLTAQGRAWAKQMRQSMQTKSDGITRVVPSAAALRRQHGLGGKPESDEQAYASLKKRTHWMRYRHGKSQGLPIGSGITEAACQIVGTQRLKGSGMSWPREGGQGIVDLRVVWLSGVWGAVHQRYWASKPMPDTQADMPTFKG